MKTPNKSQLDLIRDTISDRLQNHFRTRRERAEKNMKVPAEVTKLISNYEKAKNAINEYNKKQSEKKGYVWEINTSAYNGTEASLRGSRSLRLFNTTLYVAPEDYQNAVNAADATGEYLLKLALGTETIDALDSFIDKLLSNTR